MSVLCVIPARYASSRLPGKPLIDLAGKSMIQRVCEAVDSAACFDEIIVATDDERIYDHVSSLGYTVEMTSAEHQSGTDRCAEVGAKYDRFDYIVNVQGDEPNIERDLLSLICYTLTSTEHPGIVTAVTELSKEDRENPNKVKVVMDRLNRALYFSRSVIPFPRNEVDNHKYFRHIGIYGFDLKLLPQLTSYPISPLEEIEGLEQLRWLYYGHRIKCVKGHWKGQGIDSPEDVENYLSSAIS